MAEIKSPNFDYTKTPVTITIKNVTDLCKAGTCDAGTPAVRTLMSYDEVVKHPCMKWEYLFTSDGKFAIVAKTDVNNDGTIKSNYTTKDTKGETDVYVVTAYVKCKNTDVKIPAYRTMNAKTLKRGESMKFTTSNKDEVVFYEKVATAFSDQIKVTIEEASV